ncbi:MAG: hypothetical protein P1U56_12735 [Saprospiraceae bacterium]|nr:hypothetical protein [Saprospiraceae bacterium]
MKFKTKYKLSSQIIYGIGSVGFSVLAWFSSQPLFQHRYIQIIPFVVVGLFIFFALASMYYFFKNKQVEIEKGVLKLSSFFGFVKREYRISDIRYFTYKERSSKYIDWEELDLYFDHGKVRFYSSHFKYQEYTQLKDILTRGKKENIEKKRIHLNENTKYIGIGFLVAGGLFVLIAINQDKSGTVEVKEENTVWIEGNIVHDPKIRTGSKRKKSLTIELDQFVDFRFELNGQEIKPLRSTELLKDVRKGDAIQIRIWKESYSKKIAKTEELTFSDKHFSYPTIDILGISASGKDYLPMKAVNEVRENFHTRGNYYGLIVVASLIVGVGLLFIYMSYDESMDSTSS